MNPRGSRGMPTATPQGGKVKKSTKVLLVIFGILVVILIILLIVFRNEIFADTPTPEPGNTETKNDETASVRRTYIAPNDNKDSWESGKMDSGGTFYVKCFTAQEINNTPFDDDAKTSYTLDVIYRIDFQSRDQEYMKSVKLYYNDITTKENKEFSLYDSSALVTRRDHQLEGSQKITFQVGHTYSYALSIDVWKYGVAEGQEKVLFSYACQAFSSENPEETLGGIDENYNQPGGTENTGGSTIQECKDTCAERQQCRSIVDPICNGFCSMTCYMMELMAGAFNFAFGILHSALGLS